MGNKERCKRWYQSHREQKRQYLRTYRLRIKELRKRVLGQICVLCGNSEHIILHEVNGKAHHTEYSYFVKYINEGTYQFVALCYKHHRMIHELINFYKLDEPKQIKVMELVKKALKEEKVTLSRVVSHG